MLVTAITPRGMNECLLIIVSDLILNMRHHVPHLTGQEIKAQGSWYMSMVRELGDDRDRMEPHSNASRLPWGLGDT